MDLHGIASGAIGVVNPNQKVKLRRSSGYTIADTGRQVPDYAADVEVDAQVQDLSQRDLRHLEGQNIQGSQRVIYLSGNVEGISRITRKGGDLIINPDGTVWLTTAVLEQWPDWCKVSVTQQNDLTLSNIVPPSIETQPPTGVDEGEILSVVPGQWSGNPAPALTYQWLADGVAIVGATGIIFQPGVAQFGKKISVKETATNAVSTASAISQSVGPVTDSDVDYAEWVAAAA